MQSACLVVERLAGISVLSLRRLRRYTAMLGRKASLKALRAALYRHHPTALRTTEFAQGAPCWWLSDVHLVFQCRCVML
jgi:hypothetical protein